MQGRLSPIIEGKIQSFPWLHWEKEFKICKQLNIKKLEWTVDHEKFENNPICTPDGRRKIILLKNKYNIEINSVTADFFMQKPFYLKKNDREKEYNKLKSFIIDTAKINVKYIILPLVDNGSIKNLSQEKDLIKSLNNLKPILKSCNTNILFESDYSPKNLLKFIKKFDKNFFGINYDTGNSASLNYDFEDEIKYFKFVKNIHIKDRNLNGKTVRLGKGNWKYKNFFKLVKFKYDVNFILQTARSSTNEHIKEILINKKFIENCYIKTIAS